LKVKLIAVTQPVDIIFKEDSTLVNSASDLIGYCARVSNPANQDKPADKLIAYLIKNKHWSPFEMVSVVMEINTTRTIARQILRHRSFHFQEFSQRYAEVKDMEFEVSECRLQDTKNRQNSIVADPSSITDLVKMDEWYLIQEKIIDLVKTEYQRALKHGIAKEVARNVLPEGLTPSRMYMAGTVRDWFHYCQLRMGNGTQKEHQEVAKACWRILVKEFPALDGIMSAEDDAYNRGYLHGFERGAYEEMTQEDVNG
jgi:thymidylate synthase (FAD)